MRTTRNEKVHPLLTQELKDESREGGPVGWSDAFLQIFPLADQIVEPLKIPPDHGGRRTETLRA
jgi:hypothetical protein